MTIAALIAAALAVAVSVVSICLCRQWTRADRDTAADDRVPRVDYEAERRRVDKLMATLTALARRNVDAP